MNAAEQAADAYCSALFADLDERLDGYLLTVLTLPDRSVRWLSDLRPAAIAAAVVEADTRPGVDAVYLSVALARPDTERKGRAANTDIGALVGLWVDIDIAGPGHTSGKRLPATEEQALAILGAAGLTPSLVVRSGGGIHGYFRLAEPLIFAEEPDPDAAATSAAALVRDFQTTLAMHAHRLGRWQIDATHDLARVLRAPGSTNRKIAGEHRKVEVISHHPDAVYDVADIEAALADRDALDRFAAMTAAPLSEAGITAGDLMAIWRMVNTETYRRRKYLPEWLDAAMREGIFGPGDALLQVWNKGHLSGDDNVTDASLSRRIADLGLDPRDAAETIMCWRLRNGRKIEKVDPHRRTDYVIRTIAHTFASARAQRKLVEQLSRNAARVTAEQRARSVAHIAAAGSVDPATRAAGARSGAHDLGGATAADLAAHSLGVVTEPAVKPVPEPVAVNGVALDPEPTRAPVVEPESAREEQPSGPPPTDGATRPLTAPAVSPYGTRPPRVHAELQALSATFFGDLASALQIWRLEYTGSGATQQRRIVVRIDPAYQWENKPPDKYVPGHPLPSGPWPAGTFDKLGGWLKVIRQDLQLPPIPVSEKEFAARYGDTLVPLWEPDTSGGSLAAITRDALLSYLLDFPPLTDWPAAVAQGMPALIQEAPRWRLDNEFRMLVRWNEFGRHCRAHFGISVTPQTLAEMAELCGAHVIPTSIQDRQWRLVRRAYFSETEWAAILAGGQLAEQQREERHGMHLIEPPAGYRGAR